MICPHVEQHDVQAAYGRANTPVQSFKEQTSCNHSAVGTHPRHYPWLLGRTSTGTASWHLHGGATWASMLTSLQRPSQLELVRHMFAQSGSVLPVAAGFRQLRDVKYFHIKYHHYILFPSNYSYRKDLGRLS